MKNGFFKINRYNTKVKPVKYVVYYYRQYGMGQVGRHSPFNTVFNYKTMEIWKDIPGYEGLYQASTLGRIKSYKNGIMKAFNDKGYNRLSITKNGYSKKFLVHRLVASCFINKIEGKDFVNHKNGKRNDNRVENLEWCTHSENIIHCYRVLGKKGSMYGKMGKYNPKSKKIGQYNKNLELIKIWYSLRDIERELNINHGNISRACRGIYKTSRGYIWSFI